MQRPLKKTKIEESLEEEGIGSSEELVLNYTSTDYGLKFVNFPRMFIEKKFVRQIFMNYLPNLDYFSQSDTEKHYIWDFLQAQNPFDKGEEKLGAYDKVCHNCWKKPLELPDPNFNSCTTKEVRINQIRKSRAKSELLCIPCYVTIIEENNGYKKNGKRYYNH